MEKVPLKQMNDYTISKWAGELQCLNHGSENYTTMVKIVDFSKSRKDFNHNPRIDIYERIKRYVA